MQNTSGLTEFRTVFQYQLLQYTIFKTLVSFHSMSIDEHIYKEISSYNVFVTAQNFNEVHHEPKFTITKRMLTDLFVNSAQLKASARKKALLSYQALSENILASKTPSLIRKRLQELKVKIANEYCEDMIHVLCPYLVKNQIIAVTTQLKHTLIAFPEDNGFIVGKETDAIIATVASSSAASASSSAIKPKANENCLLTKDVLVSNVFYVPHYLQVMKMDFSLSESQIFGSNSRFQYSNKEAYGYLLEILQCNCILARFLLVQHQHTTKDLQTSTAIIADIRKLQSEISHLSDPEHTLVVKKYLRMKVELMYIKKILALQYSMARFTSSGAGQSTVEKVNMELNKFFNTNIPNDFYNSQYWPCATYFTNPVIDVKLYNTDILTVPFQFLDNFLLTVTEAETNYILGEEMNIDLQLEEVLEESKIYSTSQAEICLQTQLAFLELSYELVQLKNFYYRLLVHNKIFDVCTNLLLYIYSHALELGSRN